MKSLASDIGEVWVMARADDAGGTARGAGVRYVPGCSWPERKMGSLITQRDIYGGSQGTVRFQHLAARPLREFARFATKVLRDKVDERADAIRHLVALRIHRKNIGVRRVMVGQHLNQ